LLLRNFVLERSLEKKRRMKIYILGGEGEDSIISIRQQRGVNIFSGNQLQRRGGRYSHIPAPPRIGEKRGRNSKGIDEKSKKKE